MVEVKSWELQNVDVCIGNSTVRIFTFGFFCGDNIKYLLDFDKGNICKRKYKLIQIFVSILYKILKNRYGIIIGNYNGDFIFRHQTFKKKAFLVKANNITSLHDYNSKSTNMCVRNTVIYMCMIAWNWAWKVEIWKMKWLKRAWMTMLAFVVGLASSF